MAYKLFDKKCSAMRGNKFAGGALQSETLAAQDKSAIMRNQQLAEELRKPIIRKFEKRKVYSSFKDNIWNADIADMLLISKFNKSFRFLLCFMNVFSK